MAMEARTMDLVRRLLGFACFWATAAAAIAQPADLLLVNGRVYTFAWDEPSPDGTPAANAPRSAAGFRPDAEAVAIRDDRIVFVGGAREAQAYRGPNTRVMDLGGATVLPGLVDSHTHVVGLGEAQSQVDLVGVASEAEAVERAAAFAKGVPKGLDRAVPEPTEEQYKAYVLAGLTRMAQAGYVAVHEAGVDRRLMRAFQSLDAEGRLPVRVYAIRPASPRSRGETRSSSRRVAGTRGTHDP